jgi:hypothetical protein
LLANDCRSCNLQLVVQVMLDSHTCQTIRLLLIMLPFFL